MRFLSNAVACAAALLCTTPSIGQTPAYDTKPTAERIARAKKSVAMEAAIVFVKASEALTKDEFMAALYEDAKPNERAQIIRETTYMPVIYRVGDTAVGFRDLHHELIVELKDIVDNKIYLNGHAWVYKPDLNIMQQRERLRSTLNFVLGKSKKTAQSNLEAIVDSLLPRAAASKVRKLTTLERMMSRSMVEAKKAMRAEEKQAPSASKLSQFEERLIAAEKRAQAAEEKAEAAIKTSQASGAGWLSKAFIYGAGGSYIWNQVNGLVDFSGKVRKAFENRVYCPYVGVNYDPDCVRTVQAIENEKGPTYDEASKASIAKLAAQNWKTVSTVECSAKEPAGALRALVDRKGTTDQPYEAVATYTDKGVESIKLYDPTVATKPIAAELKFSNGKLTEVQRAKTKAELEAETKVQVEAQSPDASLAKKIEGTVAAVAPVVQTRTLKRANDTDKDEMAIYDQLTLTLEIEKGLCITKAVKSEQQRPAASAPSQAPAGANGTVQ